MSENLTQIQTEELKARVDEVLEALRDRAGPSSPPSPPTPRPGWPSRRPRTPWKTPAPGHPGGPRGPERAGPAGRASGKDPGGRGGCAECPGRVPGGRGQPGDGPGGLGRREGDSAGPHRPGRGGFPQRGGKSKELTCEEAPASPAPREGGGGPGRALAHHPPRAPFSPPARRSAPGPPRRTCRRGSADARPGGRPLRGPRRALPAG